MVKDEVGVSQMHETDTVHGGPHSLVILFLLFPGKEPWQAGQTKHMEGELWDFFQGFLFAKRLYFLLFILFHFDKAYEAGMNFGDMEYSLTNLYQYTNTALYGCGENVSMLSQNIP